MVDRVHPLKFEGTDTGGTQNDEFPTELNKNEDYVDARGYMIQDNSSADETTYVSRNGTGDMVHRDANVARDVPLIELESDSLVHDVAESSYWEPTRASGHVQNEIWWTNAGKTVKIREVIYTRSPITTGLVASIVTRQYDKDGNLYQTLTETVARTGSTVDSITAVRS